MLKCFGRVYLISSPIATEGFFSPSVFQVAPKIKAMMMESGSTMVGYQPQGNKVNFFRMVVSNAAATRSDIDFVIDEIERLGNDL